MIDLLIKILEKLITIAVTIFFIILPVLPLFMAAAILYILYYTVKIVLVKRLRFTQEFSALGVFEGNEITIIETIYNPNPLPIFFVDVESYIDNRLELMNYVNGDSALQLIISRFHLMPFTQITRRHKVNCTRRGYYKINSSSVLTKSVIMENTMYFDFDAELYVYPKIIEYNQLSRPVNLVQGSSLSMRRVMFDPFLITGIRDYSSGDPFNMINFKATAKSSFQGMQSIKVNKLDYCSDRIFMIYINFQTPDEAIMSAVQYEGLIEKALSLAASFISEALKSGYRIGLAANCRLVSGERCIMFPITGGLYHIEEILREMARAKSRCGGSFKSLLKSGMNNDLFNTEVFIITPHIDDGIDDCITLLKKHNVVTVIKL